MEPYARPPNLNWVVVWVPGVGSLISSGSSSQER